MRYYSSSAGAMTLTADITAGTSIIGVSSVTGLPTSFPYTIVLDVGQAAEEIVTVTSSSGAALTVTRGQDGTSAQAHSLGAVVRHMMTARDLREPQEHIAATSGVHGVAGAVVGTTDTQTLTNKTLGATTFSGAIAGGQNATLGAITASSSTLSGAVTAASATVNPGAAVTGLTVKQANSPTVPAVDVYEDALLGATKARVKLAPGATNIVEITGNDYNYLTGGSVAVTKDGRVTVTGSNGIGSPADPILTLTNSNPSGGATLSLKGSSGTEVAKFDKDGNLTSPTVTSLSGRITTLEGLPKVISGTASVAATAAGANTNVNITFPAGTFTSPPVVVSMAGSTRLTPGFISSTTTGATLQFTNWTSTGTTTSSAQWIATGV